MRFTRMRSLTWLKNNHMQMIAVHCAAMETLGKQSIYDSWFGIPTSETKKYKGTSDKYQHFM